MTPNEERRDDWSIQYSTTRRTDPLIATALNDALGDARFVLNVGAGSGSYEARDRRVIAVEPSQRMLAQRPGDAAPAVRAVAEGLPFLSAAFDASMAVLTIHHWSDPFRGLSEMRRVTRSRIVILTWDQSINEQWWLPARYFPGIVEIDRRRVVPVGRIEEVLGPLKVRVIPVPHDCQDGFDIAFWRRPSAYLDPRVLSSMSNFAKLAPSERARGLQMLTRDLADGTWAAKFGHLLELSELDLGLRIVIHEVSSGR